jgi:hypothetical protein
MNLAGLIVRCCQRPCPECQSVDCLISSSDAPHSYSEMICVVCNRHRGRLSKRTHVFIDSTIKQFGRPTEPILLRVKNSSASDEVTATATAVARERT